MNGLCFATTFIKLVTPAFMTNTTVAYDLWIHISTRANRMNRWTAEQLRAPLQRCSWWYKYFYLIHRSNNVAHVPLYIICSVTSSVDCWIRIITEAMASKQANESLFTPDLLDDRHWSHCLFCHDCPNYDLNRAINAVRHSSDDIRWHICNFVWASPL